VDRLAIRDARGALQLGLGYRDIPGGPWSILCVPYPDVLRALQRCLDPAVEVRHGALVEGLLRDHAGRVSGVQVTEDGICTKIPARLVIAADGCSSRLRRDAGLTASRSTYPHRLLAVELPGADVAPEVCAYLTDRGLRLVYPLPGGGKRVWQPADGYVDEGQGTANKASQISAASSHAEDARAATTARASPAASSASSGYGPTRPRQEGQRPVTDSSERHRQRAGTISWAQAGQAQRGGWPGSVLRENTLARIRGPAIKPAAAPAMIHGSVTLSSRLGLGVSVLLCDRSSSLGPATQPA
jgi:hypothetical protein